MADLPRATRGKIRRVFGVASCPNEEIRYEELSPCASVI